MSVKRWLTIVLPLILVGLVVGGLFALAVPRSGITRVEAQSTAADLEWGDSIANFAMDYPLRVQMAPVIAEVVVESVGSAEFDTATGTPPTVPQSADSLSPDHDGWYIRRPVVLSVTNVLNGDPTLTKIVTYVSGGEYIDANSDRTYVHTVSGQDQNGLVTVGTEAMIFGWNSHMGEPNAATEPWEQRALQDVAALNGGGENSLYLEVSAAYIYDGDYATSPEVDNRTERIADLRSIVENLLQ